jgi:Na+/H+-translocating membrane pyrophosphatase
VTLSETVADQELTANIRRTRDVVADVVNYGRSVPAGYAITSSELRTVLTALKNDDGRTYTETVGRVIDYLDDLASDCVEVKTIMGGERTVVFTDEFVKRTVAWRNESPGNDVVAGKGTTG